MQISKIYAYNITNSNIGCQSTHKCKNINITSNDISEKNYAKIPVGFRYGAQIHFGEFFDPNRRIPHIDYEEYKSMSADRKRYFRKKCSSFHKQRYTSGLVDPQNAHIPLANERNMDEFIRIAKIYSKYKDQPIICLGRSPKWFLNTALWMEGGIPDYKFIAFSGFWYRHDPVEGMKRFMGKGPTATQEKAYRQYLSDSKADPKSIVEHFKKTGKKTVITDYVESGKGMTSFLEVLARFAKEQGVLEDFAKAFEIVAIGCTEYRAAKQNTELIETPNVIMPPELKPFDTLITPWGERTIKQTFYDMDISTFEDMLLNQNTNECRSTYYPHEAWTIYRPDRFKTGMITNLERKSVRSIISQLKSKGGISHFTPVMFDYRNLTNFRILDALNARGLLKIIHKSKL